LRRLRMKRRRGQHQKRGHQDISTHLPLPCFGSISLKSRTGLGRNQAVILEHDRLK
jgi:hypothetical protein